MNIEKLKDGKYKVELSPKTTKFDFSFSEENDKFLFNRGKTVGFRKDKKLEKFVGLRDGYSKQLEFTIKSIKIDGNELIPNNRVNFNDISLQDDMVLHQMNSTSIFNQVTDTNFRNLIKVDEPFDNFEVIYRVHLKGIKVKNLRERDKYYFDKNGQYHFVDNGNDNTLFILDLPIAIDPDNNHLRILDHQLYIEEDELFYKKTATNSFRYKFPLLIDTNVILNNDLNLFSDGFGVIQSESTEEILDDAWENVFRGFGFSDIQVIHSSATGTFNQAVGVLITTDPLSPPPEYGAQINRTFLSYDTSIFSSYTAVLSSVKLKIFNVFSADANIDLYVGDQSDNLSDNIGDDWEGFGTRIFGNIEIEEGGITEIDIPFNYIYLTGSTKFILREAEYDLKDSSDIPVPPPVINRFTGLDFARTTLEIIFEPVKVYGQTQTNVIRGDYFYVEAFTNSGTTNDIEWYREWDGNSGYTGLLGSGSTYMGYSMEFVENNKLYAVKPFTNSPTVYSLPLEITINVTELDYATIPDRLVYYDAVDMDSIYFKFYKCLSGVCYTYIRDLNDVYEGNLLVSDTEGDESYNLYNEFDIIDEFFINSVKVDVASNQNINLSNRFNFIDGVIIRQGSRVLLMNQDNETENGIYLARHDHKLVKTDEMNTMEKLFRLKIHVRYGTYADQEIHIRSVIVSP